MTKFENIIQKAGEGSEYKLSTSERANMTRIVREYAAMKPLPQTQSYSVSISYSWLSFAHRPVAAALVLVMIFGSGVSYAAENALPGDALYTVKTYVNEPARVALAGSAEAKAEVQIELAERRIEEAAVLAAEGRLDSETENQLAVAFESHAAAVTENMAEADKEDDSASTELASRFETRLAAHEDVLLQVESGDDTTHSTRLADAIRTATEEAISLSLGTALAINVAADTIAETDSAPEPEPMIEPAATTMTMTMSLAADAPAPDAENVASEGIAPSMARNAKVAAGATAQAQVPDAKKIARMKSAAEKSLKNAQKKLKGAKSLSAEASASAEADLTLAESLIADGGNYLEADADADAFTAFKESLRISEQANVYMKAAPTLEKARSRAQNFRNNSENRTEQRGTTNIEVGPVDATITLPLPTGEPTKEDGPESERPQGEPTNTSSGTNIKVKLDLSL